MSKQVKFGEFDPIYDIDDVPWATPKVPEMMENKHAVRVMNDGSKDGQFIALLQGTRRDLSKRAVSIQERIYNIIVGHAWDEDTPLVIIANDRGSFEATGWRVADFDPSKTGLGTAFITPPKPKHDLPDDQFTRWWDDHDISWNSVDEMPCSADIRFWLDEVDENAEFELKTDY